MRTRHSKRPARIVLKLLGVVIVALAGGCATSGTGEIEAFAHDLFLGALAALLL